MTGWLSVEEATSYYDKFKIKKEITENNMAIVLKAQLDFYKYVIYHKRSCQNKWFTTSKLSAEELFGKIKEAIAINKASNDGDVITSKISLKAEDERNQLYEQNKQILRDKIVSNRRKITLRQKADAQLPLLIKDPKILVGCTIRHKLKECAGDDDEWYVGKVVRLSMQNENPKRIKYEVRYHDDPDLYDFNLIRDLEEQTMFILEGL